MTLRLKSVDELPPAMRKQVRGQMESPAPRPAPSAEAPATKKPRRYLNEPVEVDGHKFDSKSEARRYVTLRNMRDGGLITELRVHTRWPLHVQGGKLIGEYESDFDYMQDGTMIVEDTKSPRTADARLFQWKRRHFSAQYGLDIRELVERWKRSGEKP